MNVEIEFENYNIKSPKMPDPFNVNLINAVGSGGGGGGNEVELTWAEYEALSEAEKMNGTNYFITDINTTKSLTSKVLLAPSTISANTDYALADSYKNYDYVDVKITNSTGEYIRAYKLLNIAKGETGGVIDFYQSSSLYGAAEVTFTSDTVFHTNAVSQASSVITSYSKIRITGYIYQRVVVPNQMINYSTIETKIGTWIDGKPLYQKTIVFDSEVTINDSSWTLLPNTQDLYNVVASNIIAFGHGIYDNVCNVTRVIEVTRDPNLGTTGLYALSCRKNQDYIMAVTLQYTKTTD